MAKSFSEALMAKKAEDREKTLTMLVATASNLEAIESQLAKDHTKWLEKKADLDTLVERHEAGQDVTLEVAKLYETIRPPKTDHWR